MTGHRGAHVRKLVFDLLYFHVTVGEYVLDIPQVEHNRGVIDRSHTVTTVCDECDDTRGASCRDTGPQYETGTLVILQRTYPFQAHGCNAGF